MADARQLFDLRSPGINSKECKVLCHIRSCCEKYIQHNSKQISSSDTTAEWIIAWPQREENQRDGMLPIGPPSYGLRQLQDSLILYAMHPFADFIWLFLWRTVGYFARTKPFLEFCNRRLPQDSNATRTYHSHICAMTGNADKSSSILHKTMFILHI